MNPVAASLLTQATGAPDERSAAMLANLMNNARLSRLAYDPSLCRTPDCYKFAAQETGQPVDSADMSNLSRLVTRDCRSPS